MCHFDYYKNQQPWMTLKAVSALYCINNASFGTRHRNLKEDRCILSAAKL